MFFPEALSDACSRNFMCSFGITALEVLALGIIALLFWPSRKAPPHYQLQTKGIPGAPGPGDGFKRRLALGLSVVFWVGLAVWWFWG